MSVEKTRNSEVTIDIASVAGKAAAAPREWPRVLFYLGGGAVGLLLLLQISRSMDPPDTALATRDLAGVFAMLEGEWAGTEVAYLETGERVFEKALTLEYISKNPSEQVWTESLHEEGGATVHRVWRQSIREGVALSCEPRGEDAGAPAFNGRWQDGQLFWNRGSGPSSEMLRYWVEEGRLRLEGFRRAEDGSGRLLVVSGRFERMRRD